MSITINNNTGSLTILTGPMFSGKTTELLKRQSEEVKNNNTTIVLKPNIDNRYDRNAVVTHNQAKTNAFSIETLNDVKEAINNTQYIFIDEIQFFNLSIIEEIEYWKTKKKHIIVAGLDTDYLA